MEQFVSNNLSTNPYEDIYEESTNQSYLNDTINFAVARRTPMPSWVLLFYFSFIFCGLIANFIITIVLIRCKRNGILLSVLQLAMVDSLSLYVVITEIWTINQRTWKFSNSLCSLYLGSEVLSNTFVLYFIILINFHIILTFNLHIFQIRKENKNPLTQTNDEDDSISEQCLMLRSSNQISNRNVVIDYSKKKRNVSIIFPSVLVWFICLSVSVPQYILSSAVVINSNYTICTILDTKRRQSVQNLLVIFRVLIPLPLLLILFVTLLFKIYQSLHSKHLTENLLIRKTEAIRSLLIFGISITSLYIVASLQRQIIYLFHAISQKYDASNTDSYKMPPLENNVCSPTLNFNSALLHYGSITVRAILTIAILPELKHKINLNFFLNYLKKTT